MLYDRSTVEVEANCGSLIYTSHLLALNKTWLKQRCCSQNNWFLNLICLLEPRVEWSEAISTDPNSREYTLRYSGGMNDKSDSTMQHQLSQTCGHTSGVGIYK